MKIGIIGSGPAAVASATAALSKGHTVEILDFGNQAETQSHELAAKMRNGNLTNQDQRLLSSSRSSRGPFDFLLRILSATFGQGAMLEMDGKKRLGSLYTFKDVDWGIPISGTPILRSLAKGGLSNAWGAACYPLSSTDYDRWPLAETELRPHYDKAARILSLMQVQDHLEAVYPIYGSTGQPLELNPPADSLLRLWNQNKERLLEKGIVFGRTRLAVRTQENGGDASCQLCGYCLCGCPYDSIYRASWTLKDLRKHAAFKYRPRLLVRQFSESAKEVQVSAVEAETGTECVFGFDKLILAAGTLSSLRIAAESLGHLNRSVKLLDNDLYLVPFLNKTRGAGKIHFSLNELALRLNIQGQPVHIQFYCMNDQIVDQFRPLLSFFPGLLETWLRKLLGQVLIAFVYLASDVSGKITASVTQGNPVGTSHVDIRANQESKTILRGALKYLATHRRFLGMKRIGPAFRAGPGGPSGGHVSGSLPMNAKPGPLQTYSDGRLYETAHVYVTDGSSIPYLPAQNSTYTIMANAHRISSGIPDTRDTMEHL